MPSKKYTTLALPNALVSRMDEFVVSNTWGFRSRGEVLAAAVRDFLERHPAAEPDATSKAEARPAKSRAKA